MYIWLIVYTYYYISVCPYAFALTGRIADCYYTQGDALG